MGPTRPGRKIVIMGDTCDSSHMTCLAADSDVLVHEATLENEKQEEAIEKGHSSPAMAAAFGISTNAKKLVLTHFSQRYKPQSAELKDDDVSVKILLEQAKAVFVGDVVAAEDFFTLPIPRKS